MKKLTISSLLILFSAVWAIPNAIAQTPDEPNDTRIEKYEDLTETDLDPADLEATEDVEPTEDVEATENGAEEPTTRTEEKLDEYQSDEVENDDIKQED